MFELKNENGAAFYISSMLKDTGLVKHGFSTRRGGCEQGLLFINESEISL